MKIDYFCETGARNRMLGRQCQDRFSKEESNGCLAASLCDGAGFSEYGGEAADAVGKIVNGMVLGNFTEFMQEDVKDIKRFIACEINRQMETYAAKINVNPLKLATTILSIGTDGSGNYIGIQLGDGIMMMDTDHQYRNISMPACGMCRSETFLTLNCSISDYVQFYRWHTEKLKRIVLMTDGVYNNLGESKNRIYTEFLNTMTLNEIRNMIARKQPVDDFSCAVIVNA